MLFVELTEDGIGRFGIRVFFEILLVLVVCFPEGFFGGRQTVVFQILRASLRSIGFLYSGGIRR